MSEYGKVVGFQFTLPDGPRFVSDSVPVFANKKPGVPPLKFSKTRLAAYARLATAISEGQTIDSQTIQQQLTSATIETKAGEAVHWAAQIGEVHHNCRPTDNSDYRRRYGNNLEKVLASMSPTTPQAKVADMYHVLSDPRMALPSGHGEYLMGPLRTIFELLAEAALTRIKQQPPFNQTYCLPLPGSEENRPDNSNPDEFIQAWERAGMDEIVGACVQNFLEFNEGRLQTPRGIGHVSETRAGLVLRHGDIFSARPDEIILGESKNLPNHRFQVIDYKIGNPDIPTDGLIGEAHHVAAKLTADIVRSLDKIPQTGRAVRLKSADIVPPNLDTEVTITHVGLRTNPVKQVKFPGSDLWNNPDASLAERERVRDFINTIQATVLAHPELEAIFK